MRGDRRWQLADLRRARGFSQKRLAEEIDVRWNTVARWESGETEPKPDIRPPLARALDVSLERLDRVLRNEDTEAEGGEENGSGELRRALPEWLSLYVSLEQTAGTIRTWQPHVVHGLLQTSEYARTLILKGDYGRVAGADRIERLVELRMDRQIALTRTSAPLELALILSETALRTLVGNRQAMYRQLDYVATMAELPNVTLQVLPFSAGPHAATRGAFDILEFPLYDNLKVYVESYVGGALYMEEPRDVDHFAAVYEDLSTLALTAEDSLKMIRRITKGAHMTDQRWRKASYSDPNGHCVELTAAGGWIAMRDSKHPDDGNLTVTRDQVRELVDRIKLGEFDELT